MKTPAPYVLVKMDFDGHRTKDLGSGVKIEIQKDQREDWNKRYSQCDRGWVVVVNDADEIFGCPMIVRPGDYVYFHYHTFSEYNEVLCDGEVFYKVSYSNLFFRLEDDGDITPLNNFILTEIQTEQRYIPYGKTIIQFALADIQYTDRSIVAYKPPYITSVNVGDLVYHKENTHYDIELPDGRVFYRIREKDLIGVDR